jgi:hypothetical protein
LFFFQRFYNSRRYFELFGVAKFDGWTHRLQVHQVDPKDFKLNTQKDLLQKRKNYNGCSSPKGSCEDGNPVALSRIHFDCHMAMEEIV